MTSLSSLSFEIQRSQSYILTSNDSSIKSSALSFGTFKSHLDFFCQCTIFSQIKQTSSKDADSEKPKNILALSLHQLSTLRIRAGFSLPLK